MWSSIEHFLIFGLVSNALFALAPVVTGLNPSFGPMSYAGHHFHNKI